VPQRPATERCNRPSDLSPHRSTGRSSLPHGRARTDDFTAGDVGYVPQGYGHYIENTGSDDKEVVLVLNNATYESISITAWMAANPDLLPPISGCRKPRSPNSPKTR
jgi:oxalate decarboxylase/phosphoglucose isomerase-like protein (cupin superfamily)